MITFGSLNNPIKPFTIRVNGSSLNCREATTSDFENAAKFSTETSIASFDDWADYFKKRPEDKDKYIKDLVNKYKNNFDPTKNPNATFLIAQDPQKNIKAIFTLRHYDFPKVLSDPKTGHIEECLVSQDLRSKGVGAKIFSKLIDTAKKTFSDIVIEADKKAQNFYLRAGFKELDDTNLEIGLFLHKLSKRRPDIDEFIPMSLKLTGETRWWERIKNVI